MSLSPVLLLPRPLHLILSLITTHRLSRCHPSSQSSIIFYNIYHLRPSINPPIYHSHASTTILPHRHRRRHSCHPLTQCAPATIVLEPTDFSAAATILEFHPSLNHKPLVRFHSCLFCLCIVYYVFFILLLPCSATFLTVIFFLAFFCLPIPYFRQPFHLFYFPSVSSTHITTPTYPSLSFIQSVCLSATFLSTHCHCSVLPPSIPLVSFPSGLPSFLSRNHLAPRYIFGGPLFPPLPSLPSFPLLAGGVWWRNARSKK